MRRNNNTLRFIGRSQEKEGDFVQQSQHSSQYSQTHKGHKRLTLSFNLLSTLTALENVSLPIRLQGCRAGKPIIAPKR